MTREWVEMMNSRNQLKVKALDEEIISRINNFSLLDDEDKKLALAEYEKSKTIHMNIMEFGFKWAIFNRHKQECSTVEEKDKMLNEIDCFLSSLPIDKYLSFARENYKRMLDSEPIYFDGDIIITDPCYMRREDDLDYKEFEVSLIQYMERDTLYGDWSCTVYNPDTHEKLGEFCADSGMVAVALRGEVLKYNPTYTTKSWAGTVIENFKGTVQFIVTKEGNDDYSVHVVGKGINKITGEPINFISHQTGF